MNFDHILMHPLRFLITKLSRFLTHFVEILTHFLNYFSSPFLTSFICECYAFKGDFFFFKEKFGVGDMICFLSSVNI